MLLIEPSKDGLGRIIGSDFERDLAPVQVAAILHPVQIKQKYGITEKEYEKIKEEVLDCDLRNLLFHYPDGCHYDVALFLLASCF